MRNHRLGTLAFAIAAGCHSPTASTAPTAPRSKIVADRVFELELGMPFRDRHKIGTDSLIGEYEIGACTLAYDAGMYAGSIDPAGLDEFRYRVTPLDGRTATWATYRVTTKDKGDLAQPFVVDVRVPNVLIRVTCPTANERDGAIDRLSRIHFTSRPSPAAVEGPRTFSPAPELCVQTTQPLRDPAEARLRITAPEGTQLLELSGSGVEETTGWPEAPSVERSIGEGTYAIEVTSGGFRVRCADVVVRAGMRTDVRVVRYVITDPIAKPAPTAAWYGRSVLMSVHSERQTYFLSRAGDRISLAVVSQTSAQHHLDTTEPVTWSQPMTEVFSGTMRDTAAGVAIELARVRASTPATRSTHFADHLAWACHVSQQRVHEAASQPHHVGPVSTIETGCLGSPSEWRPKGEVPAEILLCSPTDPAAREDHVAFTPDLTVEWVVEWNDCHIQTKAYRAVP